MCARQLKRRVWAGRGGRRKQAIDKTENFICSLNVLWVLMSFAASLQRSCYSILLPLLLPALLPPPLLHPPCSCLPLPSCFAQHGQQSRSIWRLSRCLNQFQFINFYNQLILSILWCILEARTHNHTHSLSVSVLWHSRGAWKEKDMQKGNLTASRTWQTLSRCETCKPFVEATCQ